MVDSSSLWADAPPPAADLAICVVLPIRNEAAGLSHSLSALEAQVSSRFQRYDLRRYEVLMLANNCNDDSASIARDFARRHADLSLHIAEVELPPASANIGHVRRLLMDAAAERLRAAGPAGIIASTDGDTQVAPDWLKRIEEAIDRGADAVGGRIAIAARDDTDPILRRWRRCDDAYRLACERAASLLDPEPADPWPRHHQHFGASLAITRAAYIRVGGLPAVPHLEDEALVAALRRHDLRVRHSPDVRVVTSGRQSGRAAVGLAWQLCQWTQDASAFRDMMVDDDKIIVARFTAKRILRSLWNRRAEGNRDHHDALTHLASRWGMKVCTLTQRLAAAPTFGALWDDLEAETKQSHARVPVRDAIAGLRAWTRGRSTP